MGRRACGEGDAGEDLSRSRLSSCRWHGLARRTDEPLVGDVPLHHARHHLRWCVWAGRAGVEPRGCAEDLHAQLRQADPRGADQGVNRSRKTGRLRGRLRRLSYGSAA